MFIMKFDSCFKTFRNSLLTLSLAVPQIQLWYTTLQGAAVRVQVKDQRVGKNVVFHYRVINNSAHSVVILDIGFDYIFKDGPELSVYPVGWDINRGLSTESTSSPPGWKCRVVHQEESDKHWIEWEIVAPGQSGVAPRQTLEGFSVVLPKFDLAHKAGHFDVILSNSTRISGTLEEWKD